MCVFWFNLECVCVCVPVTESLGPLSRVWCRLAVCVASRLGLHVTVCRVQGTHHQSTNQPPSAANPNLNHRRPTLGHGQAFTWLRTRLGSHRQWIPMNACTHLMSGPITTHARDTSQVAWQHTFDSHPTRFGRTYNPAQPCGGGGGAMILFKSACLDQRTNELQSRPSLLRFGNIRKYKF